MEKLHRRKICESPLGRVYYVDVETDPEIGVHFVRIFDEHPETEPTEVRFLGFRFQIDPPPVEPIIEREYPLHYDIQRKIEELIFRYELPEIQLKRLDEWDGVVRMRPRDPEPAPPSPQAVEQAEQGNQERDKEYLIQITDWASQDVFLYNPITKQIRKHAGESR